MAFKIKHFFIITSLVSSCFSWGNATGDSKFDDVRDRGYLICGVGENNNGFIEHESPLDYVSESESVFKGSIGFEADLCRAIAIATFGSGYRQESATFKILTLQGRFKALTDNEVDVVLFSTTWTSRRDAEHGIDFGPVYFHDSQKFLVRKDENPALIELPDLKGKTICVRRDTTTKSNLISVSKQFNLGWKLEDGYSTFSDLRAALEKDKPDCDAVAGDESSLKSLKSQADAESGAEKLSIMPKTPLSYEPLAAMVAEGDSHWLDIVNYAIWSTIWAEQEGIEKEYSREFAPETWDKLTDEKNTGRLIISELGNYGEIFDRNLGKMISKEQRGRNQPRKISDDGWMIPPPMESSTIEVAVPIQTEFGSGESAVTVEIANEILEFFLDIKAEFEDNEIVDIDVFGHTDNIDLADANLELSKLRAIAVSNYITENIISRHNINVEIDPQGFGEARPLGSDSNDTPEGRALNRRVEISVKLK